MRGPDKRPRKRRPSIPIAERFWAKVTRRDSTDCWEWLGAHNPEGYATFSIRHNCKRRAHRIAYELLVGPIPLDRQLDHLCRNRACVNPAHLEPVTGRENVLRGISPAAKNATKVQCIHGHANFGPRSKGSKRQGRNCKTCHAAEERLRRAKKRQSQAISAGHE